MATLGSNKSNVLAVVEEVVAGTPVDPSAATDYVVLQPDAQMSPSFEQLTNEEIRASIGLSKTIQGLEKPTMTFSHYLKHSGTEGTAPEIDDLLEAAFGSVSVNSTQRTTASGTTVSTINVATGGTDFYRGKALLIKDSTNGYRIRPIFSVATNSITLGFNLPTGMAPAAGIGLGKCINYAPTNSGHKSLTLWMYRGNGHAVEMMAGAKVGEFGFTANAGEFVNANFNLTGTKYHFNPIRITASTSYIDFLTDGGPFSASVTPKVYRDPYELEEALETAMRNANGSQTADVSYSSSTGKFTLLTTGSAFTLRWSTGSNSLSTIGTKLGFDTSGDDSGNHATVGYTSDNAQTYAAPHTPSYDSADPLVAKYQEVLLGDATDTNCFEASTVSISMPNTLSDVLSICAESGLNTTLTTAREVTVTITALLDKYEADKFRRFRANTDTRFCYNFGTKSGGNWEAGKCGSFFLPTCTISSFELTDLDTVIGLNMELKAFVDANGNGEVYLNFL